MAKLRTRKHKVVLARSAGGDAGISVILVILGAFMFLPMVYVVMQSLKPLDELWMYPPRFYVMSPTLKNFKDLFTLMNISWVPFSRYIFNTVLVSVAGTAGHLFLASLAAYALAKIKFPGRDLMFQTVQMSLMFNATVTAITSFILMSALHWLDSYLALIVPAWCSSLGLYLMKQFMDTNVTTLKLRNFNVTNLPDVASRNRGNNITLFKDAWGFELDSGVVDSTDIKRAMQRYRYIDNVEIFLPIYTEIGEATYNYGLHNVYHYVHPTSKEGWRSTWLSDAAPANNPMYQELCYTAHGIKDDLDALVEACANKIIYSLTLIISLISEITIS